MSFPASTYWKPVPEDMDSKDKDGAIIHITKDTYINIRETSGLHENNDARLLAGMVVVGVPYAYTIFACLCQTRIAYRVSKLQKIRPF